MTQVLVINVETNCVLKACAHHQYTVKTRGMNECKPMKQFGNLEVSESFHDSSRLHIGPSKLLHFAPFI